MEDSRAPVSRDGDLTGSVLARARAAVADKTKRGIYTAEFRALLAEPLDIRPETAVSPDPTIASNRRLTGPAVRVLKRVLHHSLRWYFADVTAQVTARNRALLEVIAEQRTLSIQLAREVEGLRQQVIALEATLDPARAEARSRPKV